MRACALLVVLCCAAPGVVGAGQREDTPARSPDFLFGKPAGSVGIRGGWMFGRGQSDWYDFVTRHLTLERPDFNRLGVAADLAMAITSRFEAVGGVDFSQSSRDSEYRDFVDNNRLPIAQRTRMRTLNLTGSVRYALRERGRAVSRFAWVPARVTPYVGAGAGALRFNVEQRGDFVDFADLSVFFDVFEARGWTPSGHVFGGAEVRLRRRLLASIEGRYIWASGDLGRAWIGFDPLDLAGLRMSAGVNVLF